MAFITLDTQKLRENYEYLDALFKKHHIEWAVVTKMLCGNKEFLSELLKLDIKQVCDSRVSNLRMIKSLKPEMETIYIKPPARMAIKSIVKYADISVNTEVETIKWLSEEAKRQNKVHKVIVMIELGELREGVMRDDLIDFYESVFNLENIEIIGIGANLSCLYGILPNQDKLIQLSLYKQLIEAKFNKHIQYVSGGSSVTIPLIFQNMLPKGVNHFRVGETLYLGTDVYNDAKLENMHNDVFRLYAEIIELIDKPVVPVGDMGTNLEGKSFEFDETLRGKKAYRAILDIGLLDVEEKHITLVDESIKVVGASSDMIVVEMADRDHPYSVGDFLEFKLDYMGTLKILNSRYVDKKIKNWL